MFPLEHLMKYQVDAISAVLVADHGDGDLALRLVSVGTQCERSDSVEQTTHGWCWHEMTVK